MSKLIKMELYKLRTSKLFIILLIIFAVLNAVIIAGTSIVMKAIPDAPVMSMALSDAFVSPFNAGILMMFMFISAVSFLYLDFSDGYIKNIAGQLPNRGGIVTAKYVAVTVHNLIFFLAGVLSSLIGGALSGLVIDTENLGAAVATFCIKWLLAMGISALLMFFAVGLRSKIFGVILAVMIPLSALSLLYMGINALVSNFLKVEGFSLNDYMPDALLGSVNAVENSLVANGIIAAIVCIVLFYILTYITFKKKDIK